MDTISPADHEAAIRGWDAICELFESQSCESSETVKLDGGDVSDPINDSSDTVEPDAINSATSMTVSPLAPKSTDPALLDCGINNTDDNDDDDDDEDDDKHTIIRYKCLTFKIEGKFSIEILKYFTSLIKYEVRLTISIPLV